eukprot:gnl/Chilomastix_cuspidata/3256.p1 GENE.gnl/Chilomastix_cuspidata/3256~~gnl/Chilomastix_cuspidata/3256.p1  ORF type:complete len:586 (+),score=162.77 gnl/Chilomastix_cuspidata/3256:169-1758(+)
MNLIKISNLDDLTSLTKLCLDNNNISTIEGLEKLENLRWLDLSFNRISDISGLAHLSRLTDLSLAHNEVSAIRGLSELRSLESLSLGHNLISDFDGLLALRALPRLRALTLAGNPVSTEGDYKQYVIAHVPALRYLDSELIFEAERDAAKESFKRELLELEEKEAAQRAARKGEWRAAKDRFAASNTGVAEIRDLLTGGIVRDPESVRSHLVPGIRAEAERTLLPALSALLDSFANFMRIQRARQDAEIAEFEEAWEYVQARAENIAHRAAKDARLRHKISVEQILQLGHYPDVATLEPDARRRVKALLDASSAAADALEAALLNADLELSMYIDQMISTLGDNLEVIQSKTLEGVQLFFQRVRAAEQRHFEKVSLLALEALRLAREKETGSTGALPTTPAPDTARGDAASGTMDVAATSISVESGDALEEEYAEEVPLLPEVLTDELKALLRDKSTVTSAVIGAHETRQASIDSHEDAISVVAKAFLEKVVSQARTVAADRSRSFVGDALQLASLMREEVAELEDLLL